MIDEDRLPPTFVTSVLVYIVFPCNEGPEVRFKNIKFVILPIKLNLPDRNTNYQVSGEVRVDDDGDGHKIAKLSQS